MSRAIISLRTKDSFWHPLWDRYYRPHFDHVEVVQIGNTYAMAFAYMTELYNRAITKLFRKYDQLVCVDTDEILVPDPDKFKDLGTYLDQCKGNVIKCVGYDVMEMEGQKQVEVHKKITDQRTMWTRNSLYDKPVIIREKVKYYPGQHNCNVKGKRDEDLYMMHLRYADLKSLFMRRANANLKALLDGQDSAKPIPDKWRVI